MNGRGVWGVEGGSPVGGDDEEADKEEEGKDDGDEDGGPLACGSPPQRCKRRARRFTHEGAGAR